MTNSSISIDGKTKLYGIIGYPVSHSFSPRMHTTAFCEINYNAVYLPFPIKESKLGQLLDAFEMTGVLGFNVTVPYKEKIIPFLDELSPAARVLQTVNTVKFEDHKWKGFTTDGAGFTRSLKEARISLRGKTVLMVGAGGAAKAIAYALANKNVELLHILNRTEEKSNIIKNMLQKTFPSVEISISSEPRYSFDILINCTSVGMSSEECPVADKIIRNSRYIADIIYSPLQTTLLKKAKHFNIPCQNGLGMLLHQGAKAFEIWTQHPAPLEKMKETLLKSFV